MHPWGWLLACLPVLAPAGEVPAVKWHTDLQTARRQAKKLDRPLFVVFRCEH
jgi:hypothetical protein